jgi:ArsR family transcriptional regulator, arsenate/arsenite/antimonite-responsive transcriptional repressor / arsenate reductase (thioredoxin)
VLESAGLVERVRWAGDRRRTYVRLLPVALPTVPVAEIVVPRVVFVCTHNSARSQLAAAMWERAEQRAVAFLPPAPSGATHTSRGRRGGASTSAAAWTWTLWFGRTTW